MTGSWAHYYPAQNFRLTRRRKSLRAGFQRTSPMGFISSIPCFLAHINLIFLPPEPENYPLIIHLGTLPPSPTGLAFEICNSRFYGDAPIGPTLNLFPHFRHAITSRSSNLHKTSMVVSPSYFGLYFKLLVNFLHKDSLVCLFL